MASGDWVTTMDNLGDYSTLTYSAGSQLQTSSFTDNVTKSLHVGECDRMVVMVYGTSDVDETPKIVEPLGDTITAMAQFSIDGVNWSEIPSDGTSTRDGSNHNPIWDDEVDHCSMGWLNYNAKYLRFRHEGAAVPADTTLNIVVYKQFFGKEPNRRLR